MTLGEILLQSGSPDSQMGAEIHQRAGGKSMEIQIHAGGSNQDTLRLEESTPHASKKLDEYEIDFSDPRAFVVSRWEDLTAAALEALSGIGLQTETTVESQDSLKAEIQTKIIDIKSASLMNRLLNRIQPLPQVTALLTQTLSSLVAPHSMDFCVIWRLLHLSLKMSYTSSARLERVSDLFHEVQRAIELFNGTLENLQRPAEVSIAVLDFLDLLLFMLVDVVEYLHESSSEKIAENNWPAIRSSTTKDISRLYDTIRHVSELARIASVNQQLTSLSLTAGHVVTEPASSVVFPITSLQYEPNPIFSGRQEELKRIETFLSPGSDQSFRAYSIYGRRGVGKTSLALQFAHACAGDATYDAIFWIQCETSVAIRESFAKVAEALDMPVSQSYNLHEENLMAVKTWLKLTKRTWLLIFDNVESEKVLRPYWPTGASGAVLITSRSYFNFIKDISRQGQTVKPLDPKQSWELLLDLLGDHWKELNIKRQLPDSEIAAAKSMIMQLEGLPLAIEQTATLIKDETIGGRTIARTYEAFKDRIRSLPERLSISRSVSEKSLDTLWDITFKGLSRNARSLIGVLAWLSPDAIPIQLFQPKDASILCGQLAFCKSGSPQLLHNSATSSPGLDKAISELQEKKLVKYHNEILSIHRVVQEAVNFQSVEDLQESFNAAANLVADQFPKRFIIGTMYQDWSTCKQYISHVASLSKRFSEYSKSKALKGSIEFVELLANSSWYLFELGDYDTCEQIIGTALAACSDKKSLLYSGLRGTQGGLFFDLNLLSKCREAWEETLEIREDILSHDDPHVAGMLSNLGNLELAVGNVEAALRYYGRALQVWINSSEESAQPLAKTYLSLGRAHMYQGNLDEALKCTSSAETLAARTMGKGVGFMANVYYAYGDIHLRRDDLNSAMKAYQKCLTIGLTNMPVHPIIAATWYSLACVNFAQGNDEAASSNLNKAEAISRLRSPARDDGPIARILWKRATVLQGHPSGTAAEEALEIKAKAAEIKRYLMASGEGGTIPCGDGQDTSKDSEEDSYDALVPLFYR
ncbi:hypothetical protein IFR05_006982 [Cadophora sp. M221]|nr:hypothetical protein IFR05_006982 [Cadophora sp. M221]